MKKSILKILVASLCLSAIIGIIVILIGKFSSLEVKILATTFFVFCYSIPGLCSSSLYEKGKLRSFSIVGMLIALISCIYLISLVWGVFEFKLFSANQWKIIWTLNLLCWSCAHVSLMLLINNKNAIVSNFRLSTVILSIIIDVMILVPTWELYSPSDFYFRLLWILAILITLGTVGTPILNKIYKNNASDENTSKN